jgi:pyrimidine operon attenuation protein / uracil phosphoribosyltransferase
MIVSNSVSSVPPPQGGSFVAEPGSATATVVPAPREVLDAAAVQRAVTRMAHEIIERNQGTDGVVLVGLIKGGVWLAEALGAALDNLGSPVPVGAIDVSFFRDDLNLRAVTPSKSSLDFELHDAIVVLVDDVLFTGRTVRAALDALREYGRPRSFQLAVMVDRGHRELPIRPDFVGKNLPTNRNEQVSATLAGVVIK